MKILLSPAKSLNFSDELPTTEHTQPQFLDKTQRLYQNLVKASKEDLKDLMSISNKLAELNYERFQNFEIKHETDTARPAIFTFDGDVYDGLSAYELDTEDIKRLQNRLRILSGFYGILKPLDLMQAYRLEMGTKLKIDKSENLYEFWKSTITEALNAELKDDELIINLASQEYAKSVDKKNLKGKWIEPVFKDYKNGKLKVISFYAKKARGLMTKYLSKIEDPEYNDVLKFNKDNYAFSKTETQNQNKPVFVR